MKQIDEKTWWRYLDGECSKEERLQLESLLEEHPSMAEEWLLSKTLHDELSIMEMETPSPSFTANVMAALPEKRTITPTEPLLSAKMKWFFITLVTLIFGTLLLAPSFLGAPSAAEPVVALSPMQDALGTALSQVMLFLNENAPSLPQFEFPQIPASVWNLSMVLLIGIVSLGLMDTLLGKRMYSRRLDI